MMNNDYDDYVTAQVASGVYKRSRKADAIYNIVNRMHRINQIMDDNPTEELYALAADYDEVKRKTQREARIAKLHAMMIRLSEELKKIELKRAQDAALQRECHESGSPRPPAADDGTER